MSKSIEKELLNYWVKNNTTLNERIATVSELEKEGICNICLLGGKGTFGEELSKEMEKRWGKEANDTWIYSGTGGGFRELGFISKMNEKDEFGNPIYFSWGEIEGNKLPQEYTEETFKEDYTKNPPIFSDLDMPFKEQIKSYLEYVKVVLSPNNEIGKFLRNNHYGIVGALFFRMWMKPRKHAEIHIR
jgi:hypothetical protein